MFFLIDDFCKIQTKKNKKSANILHRTVKLFPYQPALKKCLK